MSNKSNNVDYMGSVDFVKLWAEASALLRDVIPDNVYYLWFTAIAANSFEHDKFYLVTPHQFALAMVNSHRKEIVEALTKVCGKPVDYELNYDDEYSQKYKEKKKKESSKQRPSLEDPVKKEFAMAENSVQMRPEVNLNLKYKFENFVVGENSRMAHAVALSVAERPAQKYNPLFIYGASGLGKTHLMQAIGHHILFHKPNLRVKFVKTEEYVNELILNIQMDRGKTNGKCVSMMDKFRQKYRNVDVLLIDDIQFVEAKDRTMEEIFNTFDALYNKGKQIVITSDRLPRDIPKLPDRLRTRFEMGIMVELTPPEFETRIAILRNLAEKDGLQIPCDVYDLIAKNYKNNVRELEGAYNRISAFAEIDGAELSVEYVKKILFCEEVSDEISMNSIAQAVAEYYGVSVKDFLSPARSQKISAPRHIVVYLIRELLGASFESIADFMNKKHTTMLYSYEKIRDEMKTNRDMKRGVEELMLKIKGQG